MYKHKLIFADQVFEKGVTVPANTSTTCSTAVRVGYQGSNLAVSVVAADANVALADTKTFTISLLTCDTETGSFAAPNPAFSAVLTADGAYTADLGELINRLVLDLDPDDDKWVKAVIATDDAAAAGLVDVFLEYLAN